MRLLPTAACILAFGLVACSGETQTTTTVTTPGGPGERPVEGVGVMQRSTAGASANVTLTNAEGQPAGTATIHQGPQGVLVRVEATGLTPGWHGIHFHAVGVCDGPGFQSAGAHVHDGGGDAVHGILNQDQDDSGDLPNVYADAQGRVFAELFTPFVRLADDGKGQHLLDQDGSALLIHANPDDHTSQPIGGAGDRVACGVVQAG